MAPNTLHNDKAKVMDLCELLEREEELEDYIQHDRNRINDDDVEPEETDIYEHERELAEVKAKILKKLKKEIKRRES